MSNSSHFAVSKLKVEDDIVRQMELEPRTPPKGSEDLLEDLMPQQGGPSSSVKRRRGLAFSDDE